VKTELGIGKKLRQLSLPKTLLLALAAGSSAVFSFAPFYVWPVQVVSMAILFAQLLSMTESTEKKRPFLTGAAFGFGWMLCTIAWLVIAMSRYGGMPVGLAVLALVVLCAFLSLYAGLAALLIHQLRLRFRIPLAPALLLLTPAVWMLSEWLRGWLLTGFPWAISGYAHSQSVFAGFAPVAGVYGLSLIAAFAAAVLALFLIGDAPARWRQGAVAALCVLSLAGSALRHQRWTQASGQPLQVRLLQGNVDQTIKFDQQHVNDSLALYHQMATAKATDLVAMPETALPVLSSMLPPDYLSSVRQFSERSGTAVLLGLGMHDGPQKYANSLIGYGPAIAANSYYRYDKHHLLPFGEFVPAGFGWFVKMMQIPIGDFTGAGELQMAMPVKDQWVMPNICYESLFGEEIAHQIRHQIQTGAPAATILLNASNLAWYGDSIAMPQHLQFAQMRVLETGRPMISTTNTGATVAINADGKVYAQLPYLTQGVLETSVQGYSGATPYIRFGNLIALMVSVLMLAAAILRFRNQGASV
jgi:apolipoprotein N-acyltransferase